MTQTWLGNEIYPDCKYDSKYQHSEYGCSDGFTELVVLINRCQNKIIGRYTNDNRVPPNIPAIPPWSFVLDEIDIMVYMSLRCYDLFIIKYSEQCSVDYREIFSIEIDETVDDNLVIISSVDKKYIEAVQII